MSGFQSGERKKPPFRLAIAYCIATAVGCTLVNNHTRSVHVWVLRVQDLIKNALQGLTSFLFCTNFGRDALGTQAGANFVFLLSLVYFLSIFFLGRRILRKAEGNF